MPEVRFTLAWPDGALQHCYSPSRSIEDALCAGARYPVGELVARTRTALEIASERVREARGFACTAAAQQISELEVAAREHAPDGAGHVEVRALAIVRREPDRPPVPELDGHVPVVVVGGGQAGLAAAWYLREQGVEHVVLERGRLFGSWRDDRWDAFCLVTPNWQCRLPGHPYAGDDPDGFMVKDEILEYLEDYVDQLRPPVHEGVAVTALRAGEDGAGFVVETSAGTLTSDQVILAVGGYHVPRLPALAQRLPAGTTVLHSSRYRRAGALPDGGVLVVGSGQSGAQIAEDLHLEGREVHLAVGSAPRVARFYRGRDCVAWLHDMGRYDLSIDQHPMGDGARHEANHYVTGRDGGRDIDLRRFATEGMRLHGRLLDVRDGVARFGDRLAADLDNADAVAERIKDSIDEHIAAQRVLAPDEPRAAPVWAPPAGDDGSAPLDLAAADVTTAIFSTGFTQEWSWVAVPAFDGTGYPTHHRGITSVPGLYVLGLPWLHTWGSGRFAGIARDAGYVVDHLAARHFASLGAERATA